MQYSTIARESLLYSAVRFVAAVNYSFTKIRRRFYFLDNLIEKSTVDRYRSIYYYLSLIDIIGCVGRETGRSLPVPCTIHIKLRWVSAGPLKASLNTCCHMYIHTKLFKGMVGSVPPPSRPTHHYRCYGKLLALPLGQIYVRLIKRT